jgi:hypothetical protein
LSTASTSSIRRRCTDLVKPRLFLVKLSRILK